MPSRLCLDWYSVNCESLKLQRDRKPIYANWAAIPPVAALITWTASRG